MKVATIVIGSGALAMLALASCTTAAKPGAAPTATRTVTEPGAPRAITHTVTKRAHAPAPTPSPTVTVTQTVPGSPSSQHSNTPGSGGAGQVIVRFSGSGTQQTAAFNTPSSWALSWAYWGCPGGRSNFIVTEYNADGSPDLNGVSVNELGKGRGPVATHAYGDAGRHYLSVDTEGCHWSLVPVTV